MRPLRSFLSRKREPMRGAAAAYDAALVEVRAELEKLKVNISNHQKQYAASNQTNWGFSGDLQHVLAELRNLNRFIGGDQ